MSDPMRPRHAREIEALDDIGGSPDFLVEFHPPPHADDGNIGRDAAEVSARFIGSCRRRRQEGMGITAGGPDPPPPAGGPPPRGARAKTGGGPPPAGGGFPPAGEPP